MLEAPAEIIAHHASNDAAEAFVAYRKGMGKRHALTARAAIMVSKSLQTIREQGGCPDEALDMAQERSWMTVKPVWYWNAKQQEGGALRVVNGNDAIDNTRLSDMRQDRADPALEQILRVAQSR